MQLDINFKENYGIEMWDEEKIRDFQDTLLQWFDENKRDLPWRRTKDPYKIWVSEIMLQQTQVITVIPYYERFIEKYPTVEALAKAEEDDLLKTWEGLGYYSRVRNMQTAAQMVVDEYDGELPSTSKELENLKGVGPYTAGAIASIAFDEPTPAIDGNAMRVFSRLFEIEADIAKSSSLKIFEAVGQALVDEERPGDFNQAIMDLGATICTPKNYDPSISPVKEFNASYKNETWEKYPVKSKAKKAKPVTYFALLIQNKEGEWLLEKRPQKGLLANMWTFPLIEASDVFDKKDMRSFPKSTNVAPELSLEDTMKVAENMSETYDISPAIDGEAIGTITHIFSHLKWTIHAYIAEEHPLLDVAPERCDWVKPENFETYTFPVLQQKIVSLLEDSFE